MRRKGRSYVILILNHMGDIYDNKQTIKKYDPKIGEVGCLLLPVLFY